MMFARILAFACLVLGTEAFFMGTPLRTPALSTSCRTATSMKVPTDHPEIEVCFSHEDGFYVYEMVTAAELAAA